MSSQERWKGTLTKSEELFRPFPLQRFVLFKSILHLHMHGLLSATITVMCEVCSFPLKKHCGVLLLLVQYCAVRRFETNEGIDVDVPFAELSTSATGLTRLTSVLVCFPKLISVLEPSSWRCVCFVRKAEIQG